MIPSDIAATPSALGDEAGLARCPARRRLAWSSVSPSSRSRPSRTSSKNSSPVGRGVEAHLAERLALREAGHAGVEDEGEDLAVAGRRRAVVELGVDDDGVGVRTVGDERLLAVEHVAVAVAAHRRLHAAERVRPGAGLGERPGADLVQGDEVGHPALLLGERAARQDRGRAEAEAHAERADEARADPADLLDQDDAHARLRAAAESGSPPPRSPPDGRVRSRSFASSLASESDGHRVDAERLPELAQDVVRRQVAELELLAVRADLGVDELPDRRLDRPGRTRSTRTSAQLHSAVRSAMSSIVHGPSVVDRARGVPADQLLDRAALDAEHLAVVRALLGGEVGDERRDVGRAERVELALGDRLRRRSRPCPGVARVSRVRAIGAIALTRTP